MAPRACDRFQRLTSGERHVERPLRGDMHGGCGGRAGETHREKSRQGAPVRPNLIPSANGPAGQLDQWTPSGVRHAG
jgi:hypothetical protein